MKKYFENQTSSFEVSLENQTSHLKESFHWLYPNSKEINVAHKQIEGKIAPCLLIRYLRVIKPFHLVFLFVFHYHLQIGNQQLLELKIDEVGCTIGLNSSFPKAAINTTGPIGKYFIFQSNES